MSDDYTAQMIQWIMDQAAAGDPQQIPEYDIDPEDWVQDQARRMNLYQDTLSNQADMSVAAMAGPQAYAPGAFQSQSTYTPVEQPGTQALRAYAARGNTPEGIIAQGILAGSTAAAEIARLQAAYDLAKKNGTLEGSILEQIPMGPPDDMGVISPDWESLGFRMGDIEEAYFTEAQGGTSGALFDPVTGEFVGGGNRQTLLDENGQPVLADVETSMSEAAQWYADQGLSLPTDQFSAWDLMDPNQGQYGGEQLAGTYDAWQQAMQNWQAETMALPPGDLGKAGQLGQAPMYDKAHPAAAAAPGAPTPNDANTLAQIEQASTIAPVVDTNTGIVTNANNPWPGMDPTMIAYQEAQRLQLEQERIAQQENPQQSELWWQNALANVLGGNRPAGAPEASTPITAAAPTPGGGGGSIASPIDYTIDPVTGQPVLSGGVGNNGTGTGGGGAGGTGAPRTAADLGGAQQPGVPPGGYVHNGAIFDAQDRLVGYVSQPQQQYNVPGQAPVDPNASGPPTQQFNPMDVLGSAGFAPNTSTRTGPEPSDTMAMLGHILGLSASNTSERAPSTAGAPPGGYVHNGAIFDAQDRLVGYTSSGGGGTPSSTRTGPEPSESVSRPSWWQQSMAPSSDQQVRIGKRTKGTRSNAPTVRDYYPKPRGRDTSQSRMAQENANAAWQRQRQNQRAAGVGTGSYGRAAAAARWLAEQGITPLSTQQAARRAASGPYGV